MGAPPSRASSSTSKPKACCTAVKAWPRGEGSSRWTLVCLLGSLLCPPETRMPAMVFVGIARGAQPPPSLFTRTFPENFQRTHFAMVVLSALAVCWVLGSLAPVAGAAGQAIQASTIKLKGPTRAGKASSARVLLATFLVSVDELEGSLPGKGRTEKSKRVAARAAASLKIGLAASPGARAVVLTAEGVNTEELEGLEGVSIWRWGVGNKYRALLQLNPSLAGLLRLQLEATFLAAFAAEGGGSSEGYRTNQASPPHVIFMDPDAILAADASKVFEGGDFGVALPCKNAPDYLTLGAKFVASGHLAEAALLWQAAVDKTVGEYSTKAKAFCVWCDTVTFRMALDRAAFGADERSEDYGEREAAFRENLDEQEEKGRAFLVPLNVTVPAAATPGPGAKKKPSPAPTVRRLVLKVLPCAVWAGIPGPSLGADIKCAAIPGSVVVHARGCDEDTPCGIPLAALLTPRFCGALKSVLSPPRGPRAPLNSQHMRPPRGPRAPLNSQSYVGGVRPDRRCNHPRGNALPIPRRLRPGGAAPGRAPRRTVSRA
mmetsp:Transcript_65641/g.207654  ORF Transcript_65641/g.207654 Transcript_65641/m.207654 type:complete len:545 (+) Transcript_65641:587-2221(+)